MPAKERPSTGIGVRLREARERRGVPIRTIANRTKISVSALEALERNDISKLPGGIFSRAFVRSYAAEVGLDPEETIREFIAQFPNESVTAGHPTASRVDDNEAIESSRRIARAVLWLFALSIPIVAAVLYFGIAGRSKTDLLTTPELSTAPAQAPASEPVQEPPHLSDAVDPTREPRPASTVGGGNATPAPAPQAHETKPEGTSGTLATTAVPERLSIALSASGRTRIALTVDGVPAPERQLAAGEREMIEARRDFVVWVEDAGVLQLMINGAPARALGEAGEPAMVRVNLANFRQYLAPR